MLAGTCLCGAVRYETSAEPSFSGHCYCADCRRETGTGHLAITPVPDASVKSGDDAPAQVVAQFLPIQSREDAAPESPWRWRA
jgi:hypothetical protein